MVEGSPDKTVAFTNAMAARNDYLSLGTAYNPSCVPFDVLKSMTDAVEGTMLPPHAAYDAGWLELEMADLIARQYPDYLSGDHPPGLDPAIYATRALERWKQIHLTNSSPALYRSRSLLAIGMVGVSNATGIIDLPRTLVGNGEQAKDEYQIPAAKILLGVPERRKDPEQDHELHCQTLMMILMQYARLSEGMVAVPAPSRFRIPGNDAGYDMLVALPDRQTSFKLVMRAQDPGILHDRVVLPPSMLFNVLADPRQNHGTLRACIEIERMLSLPTNRAVPKSAKIMDERYGRMEQFVRSAHAQITQCLGDLARNGERNVHLTTDFLSDIHEVREWYNDLPGTRRMRGWDEGALEAGINVYEAAFTDEMDAQDIYRLGELWLELSALPGKEGGYDRAADVFIEAGIKAQEGQNWSLDIDSKVGAATAKMLGAMREGPITTERRDEYLGDLWTIGTGIVQGANTEKDSPHLPHLLELAKNLAANLAVNTDPDMAHIAVFPTLRQRKRDDTNIGTGLNILPMEEDETFQLHNAGRIRFEDMDLNSLDFGIATIPARLLKKLGWRDDLEMLTALLEEVKQLIENPDFEPDPRIEKIRNFLLEKADAVRFI